MALKELTDSQIKAITGRKHTEYDNYIDHWDFLELAYSGGREFFCPDNIFRYIKEGNKQYAQRLKRAYRFNHTREVVDLVNKHLFRAEINRSESAPKEILDFWKQSTLLRRGIDQLMFQISAMSSQYGRPWVVVEASVKDRPKTRRDEIKLGYRNYAYLVKPQQVRDYAYDDDGNLLWIVIAESWRDDEDPFDDMGAVYQQYRVWTQNEWYLIRDGSIRSALNAHISKDQLTKYAQNNEDTDVAVVDKGEHGLGVVPVIPADHMETPEGDIPAGLIADIAYLDRACANYLSNLDEIIQMQTFSQLAIPEQGTIMPSGAEDFGTAKRKEEQRILKMGVQSIFTYNGESGAQPFYLSPDPKQAGLIMDVFRKLVTEIYSSVGLSAERNNSDNAVGIDNKSGVSKAFDEDKTNALLQAKGRSLQRIEREMIAMVMRYRGKEYDPDEMDLVTYSDDYDVRSLHDDLNVAKQLADFSAPAKLRKKQMKVVAEKMFPQMKDSELGEIITDIEAWEAPGALDAAPEPMMEQSGKATMPGMKSKQGSVVKSEKK